MRDISSRRAARRKAAARIRARREAAEAEQAEAVEREIASTVLVAPWGEMVTLASPAAARRYARVHAREIQFNFEY